MLANHMGHSINIHKEFYRLQESTIEITKVGRLLAAVDSGSCLITSPTQQDEILEQGKVSTKDSEEDTHASEKRLMKRKSEETNLPPKEKRKLAKAVHRRKMIIQGN
jgi:hypothetical protein